MDAKHVIDAFGGVLAVAERFGASKPAVYSWRHLGIPARFWIPMLDAAKAKRIAGVTRDAVMWRPDPALRKSRNKPAHSSLHSDECSKAPAL